ncbi:MAG: tripartite tricarboxylate transporter permease [Planctomycetaceae bacterium]|nr:tripartite tricarboxylate transporter permease [Planctomycetaceae bacterium]
MDMFMLMGEALLAAILGGLLYAIIGIIPGTDETSTMAPVTLILVLLGIEPIIIFSWVMATIVAMQITHTVPTAMAALPGSTMAVPMVFYCSIAKRLGIPHIGMRKMAAGSLVGSVIALPISIACAVLFSPLGDMVKPYIGLVFALGALFVAYMSKAKWAAVLAVFPFAFLIQGLQRVAVEAVGHGLFISIFMGITIGPMLSEIFNVIVPHLRAKQGRDKPNEIWLAPETKTRTSWFPNPFKLLTRSQNKYAMGSAAVAGCTFTFSPVGMTVMLGEIIAGRKKELYDRVTTTLAVQDSVSNATYIGELIIPLLAFGLPLSPVALGPAAPLFNAPPRFTTDPINNLHNFLTTSDYLIFGIIGIIGGAIIAFPVAIKKARSWTALMFRVVSHEALIGAFLGLICMLAYYEAGLFGVLASRCVGFFGGILHNFFGINTGVQFMAYYASGWIVATFLALCKFAS